jgi:gliding motility-associated-like protein
LYTVKVTNQYGCSDTTAIKIDVWKKPVADGGPDLKTRLGLPLILRGKASGTDVSSYWSLSNNRAISSGPEVKVTPTQTTRYTYNVTSRHGCGTSTDDVLVKVYERVTIPNAFSPNGDGINDVWNIEPLELFSEAVTQVYNRYGQMVHSSRGYNKPWDGTNNGKPVPVGTYFYIIDLRVKDEPKMTGSVTVLR